MINIITPISKERIGADYALETYVEAKFGNSALSKEIMKLVERLIEAEKVYEREECAQVAQRLGDGIFDRVAAAIRARGREGRDG